VSTAQVGPFETALNNRGMAQVNQAQVSLSKAASKEEGMAEIGSAQVGPNAHELRNEIVEELMLI
jgi:hypothetical protein